MGPDELRKLVSSKTKMIVVCNPNNPTGAIMHHEIMDLVIRIDENDCWILSDEVYRGAELKGEECRSFAFSTEKTIVNAGLSKAYSLRVYVLDDCWFKDLHQQSLVFS